MDSQPTGSVTSTENRDPWSGQQPYLSYGFDQAKQLYDNGQPNYFPNSTVTPFSNQTEQGLSAIENRANAGSPLVSGAQDKLGSIINGDSLSSGNPYFSQMADSIAQQVRPRLDAQFAMNGNYGTPQHERVMADSLANALAPIAYQNYNAERGAQNQAIQFAPQLAAADYTDPSMLLQAGAQREQKANANLQDQINRFNFEQNIPQQSLQNYMTSVAGGNYGGTGTSTQPTFGSTPAQLAGLGLGGALAYGSLFGQNGAFPGSGISSWFS